MTHAPPFLIAFCFSCLGIIVGVLAGILLMLRRGAMELKTSLRCACLTELLDEMEAEAIERDTLYRGQSRIGEWPQ